MAHSITALPGSQVGLNGELGEIAEAPFEKGQRLIETPRAVFDVEKAGRQKGQWRLVGWLTIKDRAPEETWP